MKVSHSPERSCSPPPSPFPAVPEAFDGVSPFPLGLKPLSDSSPALRDCLKPPTTFEKAIERCGRAGSLPLPNGLQARVYPWRSTPSAERRALQQQTAQLSQAALALYQRIPSLKLLTLWSVYEDASKDLATDAGDFAAIALYRERSLVAFALVEKPESGSSLHVVYLGSNPLSVAKLPDRPSAVGRTMMALCEDLSVAASYGGSISLYALDNAVRWYRKLGFEHQSTGSNNNLKLPPRSARLQLR